MRVAWWRLLHLGAMAAVPVQALAGRECVLALLWWVPPKWRRRRAPMSVRANGVEYTVGALVRANYGARELLRVDGVPVGRAITLDEVPSPRPRPPAEGSITVVLTTGAPLLPIQCQRLARRVTTGLAWVRGIGASSNGDIFVAFAAGNGCVARSRSAGCG